MGGIAIFITEKVKVDFWNQQAKPPMEGQATKSLSIVTEKPSDYAI